MSKTIYLGLGEKMKVTCLQDLETGENYFLINKGGQTARAEELVAGNVLFTTDESKRTFPAYGLIYELFLYIKKMAPEFGTEISLKKLAGLFSDSLFENEPNIRYSSISSTNVGRLCRDLGLSIQRKKEGFVVLLDTSILADLENRFETGRSG